MMPHSIAIWSVGPVLAVAMLLATPGQSAEAGEDALEIPSAVAQLAGGEPERCVFSGPSARVCRWSIEGRLINRRTASDTSMALNLICEVGTLGNEVEPQCDVHPVGPRPGGLPHVGAAAPAALSHRVLDQVAGARTTASISHVIGDIPQTCVSRVGVQRCEWAVPATNEVASSALLSCELPLDGGPRPTGSCKVIEQEGDA